MPLRAGSLQPAAHTGLVVAICVTEAPLQVRLLTRDDAVTDRQCQGQGEDQRPWASCSDAEAAIDEKHPDVDWIAAPAVNAGCHQLARGLVGGHRRPGAGEVADTRGGEGKTTD